MSLGYPNQNGGRTTDAALFHALGNIFQGSWVSGFKVRQGSPLGMSVRIGGEANIPDDLLMKDGAGATFPVSNMSTQPVVATVATANSANPRIDSVVVYIDSAVAANHTAANNQNRTKVAVVSGTPATSPSAPSVSQIKSAVGSNSPYVVLADIRVNRGVTSISDANITDRRDAVRLNHAPVISDSAQLANDIVLPRHISTTNKLTIANIDMKTFKTNYSSAHTISSDSYTAWTFGFVIVSAVISATEYGSAAEVKVGNVKVWRANQNSTGPNYNWQFSGTIPVGKGTTVSFSAIKGASWSSRMFVPVT